MEDHQKVHHSYWEQFQEIVQDPSVTMSPTLTAFQSVRVDHSAIAIFTLSTQWAFSIQWPTHELIQ